MAIPFRHDPDTFAAAWTTLNLITKSPTVMLYIGPDQIMPLMSVFSAIVGVVLMFWSRLVAFASKCWMAVNRRRRSPRGEAAE